VGEIAREMKKLNVFYDTCPDQAKKETLVVLLPCAYGTPDDWTEHGFVHAVRTRRIAADVAMVDMHANYYTAGQVVERLHQDVIAPAHKQGFRHIWLAGISLGGYGAALYSQQHGAQLAGILLLAPFLGNRSVIAEIASTGLVAWQPGEITATDEDRKLWVWLQGYGGGYGATSVKHPPLYLGYGLQDRFIRSSRLLEAVVPSQNVNTVAGGHEWQTWRKLWDVFLERGVLPRMP